MKRVQTRCRAGRTFFRDTQVRYDPCACVYIAATVYTKASIHCVGTPREDMGQHDLQAASSYINNSLISRGLLRKGEEIEWARPKSHPGGTEATMVKIIRLVNDLIVSKDVCARVLTRDSN